MDTMFIKFLLLTHLVFSIPTLIWCVAKILCLQKSERYKDKEAEDSFTRLRNLERRAEDWSSSRKEFIKKDDFPIHLESFLQKLKKGVKK